MFRSWKLGTAFGIGIFVHWSFLILPVIALLSSPHAGWQTALHILTLIAAVFGCVVLHELGHALMARRFGIGTRDITLLPIGGVARLERMSEKPWEEFWIAVAGPAVNVVIVVLLTGVLLATNLLVPLSQRPWQQLSFGEMFLLELGAINVIMILFNMLPAFPMDGGRVFRAILASRLGHLPATEIAASVGLVVAGLMVLAGMGLFQWTGIGLLQGSLPLVLVGLFVIFAGQQERMMVRQRERVRELKRRGLWPSWYDETAAAAGEPPVLVQSPNAPDPALLAPFLLDPSALPAEPNFSGFTWDAGRRAWIEWRNGQPVHICWVE